jgi:hypothetical protein
MPEPTKRERAPPGPVPTISDLAGAYGWVWAHCVVACNHSAAIPLAPIIARLGTESSSDRLRAALKCSKCGRREMEINLPSWGDINSGYAKLPLDRVPHGLRDEMR